MESDAQRILDSDCLRCHKTIEAERIKQHRILCAACFEAIRLAVADKLAAKLALKADYNILNWTDGDKDFLRKLKIAV